MKKRPNIAVVAIAFALTFGTLIAAKGAMHMHHHPEKYSQCHVNKQDQQEKKERNVQEKVESTVTSHELTKILTDSI